MPVETQITVNPAQVAEATRLLADVPQGLPRALTRAVNAVASSARSEIVREVGAALNLKAGDIRCCISLKKADFTTLSATVRVTGKRVTLERFGARWSPKQAGASYMIRRAGGRVVAPHTFEQTMESGHVGVFKRTGVRVRMDKGAHAGEIREQIQEKAGPSVPEAILGTTGPGIEELSQEILDRRVAEDLANQVDKHVGLLAEGKAGAGGGLETGAD
jgi:hypothetical protein